MAYLRLNPPSYSFSPSLSPVNSELSVSPHVSYCRHVWIGLMSASSGCLYQSNQLGKNCGRCWVGRGGETITHLIDFPPLVSKQGMMPNHTWHVCNVCTVYVCQGLVNGEVVQTHIDGVQQSPLCCVLMWMMVFKAHSIFQPMMKNIMVNNNRSVKGYVYTHIPLLFLVLTAEFCFPQHNDMAGK